MKTKRKARVSKLVIYVTAQQKAKLVAAADKSTASSFSTWAQQALLEKAEAAKC